MNPLLTAVLAIITLLGFHWVVRLELKRRCREAELRRKVITLMRYNMDFVYENPIGIFLDGSVRDSLRRKFQQKPLKQMSDEEVFQLFDYRKFTGFPIGDLELCPLPELPIPALWLAQDEFKPLREKDDK